MARPQQPAPAAMTSSQPENSGWRRGRYCLKRKLSGLIASVAAWSGDLCEVDTIAGFDPVTTEQIPLEPAGQARRACCVAQSFVNQEVADQVVVTTPKAGQPSDLRRASLPNSAAVTSNSPKPTVPHQPPDELQAPPSCDSLEHLLALVAPRYINQPNQFDSREAGIAQARDLGQVDTQDIIHKDLSFGKPRPFGPGLFDAFTSSQSAAQAGFTCCSVCSSEIDWRVTSSLHT
ncbi:MAG TPA: hypothetical protein VMW62_03940 [Chloroflexota bacterium]|nr:hypothetical protein [Chloroflexota bacterium]